MFYRLFRLFIYVIIAPLFVTGIFLFYYQNYSKTEILENYLTLARISSGFIKQNIENIALRFDFANELAPKLDNARQKAAAQSSLDDALKNNPDFVFLAMLDSTGKEIMRSASKEISANIPAVNFMGSPALKATGEIIISGFDARAPFPLVEIIYPTKDRKYLFAVVNLFSVWDKFAAQPIGQTGGIYFANAKDGFLVFSGRPVPDVAPAALGGILRSGKNLVKEMQDAAGDKLVGAFASTPLPGTYIMVLQYRKEAFYTISLISWLIVFFILATTTLSYFAALSFSQEVSEPVEKLTAAAQKIAGNDFNVSLDPKGAWGEFELLIKTFNAMAADLGNYSAVQLDKILDEKKKTDMLARLMRDGVVMCSMAGEKFFINQTAAKILDSDALCPVLENCGKNQKPRLKDLLALKSGTVFTYREPGQSTKAVHFEILIEFFKPANEEQVAVIIFRDITSEHEINEMKTDIFNSVAHDLRAPLLGLQVYIMLMQEQSLTPKKQKEMLDAMENSSKTLTSLIENILDASKIERGLLQPKKAPFDVSVSAQKIIDSLAPLAKRRGTEIINQIPPGTMVDADKNLIERVFTNLISNAVKFTENGQIQAKYAARRGFHNITISDSGLGMKEADLGKIFEKYRQLPGSPKGYGLGLNISKQIINAHGGDITVKSREGKGAQFTFTIPKAAAK